MAVIIDLITSSSPRSGKRASFKSSPLSQQFKDSVNVNDENSSKSSKLNQSFSMEETNSDYERFKINWRKHRMQAIDRESGEDDEEEKPKKRRISDGFIITEISDNYRNVNDDGIIPLKPAKITFGSLLAAQEAQSSSFKAKRFKNKTEAVSSVRIYMSAAMAEAYGPEIQRRFAERSMADCVASDISNVASIPAEVASFRWKFVDSPEFLEPRLFILDSELLWDDFIAPKRFKDLLMAYHEPKVFLYFMNWKRAAQKHNSALNKQFKNALNTSSEVIRLVPANELENDFFLTAADLRLQINFGNASNAPQAVVDLMDFVIEMTRIVALDAYIKESKEKCDERQSSVVANLNITLARDVKVKCGKDARDCWVKSLCQIPRVTRPLADTIATRYPSFGALMEAYAACRDVDEKAKMLAELRLDEHSDAGNGNRRLGPVISERIYSHFYSGSSN